MELEIKVADDMQATPRVKRARQTPVSSYRLLSRSEYVRIHRLLLAQALAVSFYILMNEYLEAV